MPRASRLPSVPAPPPTGGDGMLKFYVGDTAEIKNVGLHGFQEGEQVIVTEIGIHDNLGNSGYKVDRTVDGRHRSRYIDEKDLRKPKKVIHPLPYKLSKQAREQTTLTKATALQRAIDRDKAERQSRVKVRKDPVDQNGIADAGSKKAVARSENIPAKAKGTPPASQKAGGKPSEPKKTSSPKLRRLKVPTEPANVAPKGELRLKKIEGTGTPSKASPTPKVKPKTAKVLATAKKKADPKPKGTKGKPKSVAKPVTKPKSESGSKVARKKAQLR